MTKKPDFLHVDTDSWKLKVILKKTGVRLVKNGCGHSGLRILKLAVSQEGNYGINWFWCVDEILESKKLLQ